MRKHICWMVGDGTDIRLWDDPWIPTLPNFKPSPPSTQPVYLFWVCDLFIPGTKTWNFSLLQTLFNDFEVQAILHIKIPASSHRDRLLWLPTKNGCFSTKSFYKTIQDDLPSSSSCAQSSSFPWQKLWSLPSCAPKVKMFAWRLLTGVLAVRSAIGRFVDGIALECPFCYLHSESIDHLFIHCHFTQHLLFASSLSFRIEDPNLTITDLLSNWISLPNGEEVLCYGICLLWCLWKSRNDLVFSRKHPSMESILSATNSLVTNYSYVSGDVCTAPRDCIQSGLQHWMPPIDSYFKINVDGAVGKTSSSCSAVARDFQGVFHGCGTLYNAVICDPLEAEAQAFLLGIECARRLNLSHCIIEGDAQLIVHYISYSEQLIPWKIRPMILNIQDSISSFLDIKFQFVHRSGNSVAHELAQFALKFKISDWWWSSDPPSCIVNLLSADFASV
ncbi:Reverse transcriptase zinc-binding domain [Macleaya cordata]|uniref:Reverse transcriptase zinc-binding domain n=1 Tax=Macleaya cordata TaxID=56857 RepID=A0A200QZB1_MACCD|nr:Reverse transcriptase zinc-binding domain [Macleaya cordata]